MEYKNKLFIGAILGLVLVVGVFFRFYRLPDIPTGFFCDEASIGYNAYELLKTGHDEYNVPFPFFFKSFGEYKNPIEIYSSIPSIFLFGLNEFSTRIVSAIFGVACIPVLFFLTKELFKSKIFGVFISLSAALLLAISPWHIHMSRIAMEGIIPYVLFVMLGTYFFLKSRERSFYLFLSAISFCLGMYTYFPSRAFIPLFLIVLFAIYYRQIKKDPKIIFLTAIVTVLLLLPYLPTVFNGSVFSRWQQVSIFSSPPKNESIFMHIVVNYIRHFSLDFLFLKGDSGMPGQFITRQSIQGMGELYLFQLPFIMLGIFFTLKRQFKEGLLLLLWILIYPLGSMFTVDESPTATRSIIGIAPFTILSAVGIYFFIYITKKALGINYAKLIAGLLVVIVAVSTVIYGNLYFNNYPLYSSDFWGWQYGAKPVIQYFTAHEHQYNELFMEGVFNAPYIFFKFYAPNDCSNCALGTPTENFDSTKKQLFAVSSDYLQKNNSLPFVIKKVIYYPNKTPAFYMGEIINENR